MDEPLEPKDNELVARTKDGDASAFDVLVRRYSPRVYGLVYNMTSNHEETNDLLQDIFLKAFRSIKGFRGDSSFYTWIHTIATSVSLNGLRKVKKFRTRESSLDDALTVGAVTRRAEPDLKERLRQAIDNLPEGYRTVFVMHDMEGYTHEEIATALGVQPGTSKAQLFRARAKLREALADFAGEWVS